MLMSNSTACLRCSLQSLGNICPLNLFCGFCLDAIIISFGHSSDTPTVKVNVNPVTEMQKLSSMFLIL